MLEALITIYRPRFARTIIYMLQATEYKIGPYLRWFWRTSNFSRVTYRKDLVMTRPARLLLRALQLGMILQYIAAAVFIYVGLGKHSYPLTQLASALLLITPILWAHLVVVPLLLGRWLIIKPHSAWQVRGSKGLFAAHKGLKIAVAGSYGKTTMKEILLSVLSQGKKVAATPANKNVAISHAQFAKNLSGDEDILIIEYGEGAPGDVEAFARVTKPDIGIITGLAPAHLDKYKTLHQAGKDIFSLSKHVKPSKLFVNGENEALQPFIKKGYQLYNSDGVDGWKLSHIKTTIRGVSFSLSNKKTNLHLQSRLLGAHQVGPLALAAVLAHQLGLSDEQIKQGFESIEPYEHRMRPRQADGAWIIDDTYNGNIEGMKAGLQLLSELPAKRKIYVTPGLVDQGAESAQVHRTLGEAIAKANPDLVVLMKNSVTKSILDGIGRGGFTGELVIEEDPLNFYTNLDQFVAAGDLLLLQNDWPDNYS